LSDQVIGTELTVCRACAKAKGIAHDPAGRRKVELARQQKAVRAGKGAADIAEDFWSEMLGDQRKDRERHPDVVDLVARLLR